MPALDPSTLPAKGRALLNVIVDEIRSGRVKKNDQKSFIPYSEALAALGQSHPEEFSGRRLQREGLNDLNEWTRLSPEIPKICGLIVNKGNWVPSDGYPESHGRPTGGNWEKWWLEETAKSIDYDWSPYL